MEVLDLTMKWYSVVAVSIVGSAVVWSVYVLWRKEFRGKAAGAGAVIKTETETETETEQPLLVPILLHRHESVCWPEQLCLWTSCWRGLHPAFLLGSRVLSFLFMALFLSWDLYVWDASIFIYYTEWTHILVMAYFAIGSVISAHGCWLDYKHYDANSEIIAARQRRGDLEKNASNIGKNRGSMNFQRQRKAALNFQRVGFWGFFMQIAYQISAGAVILTDIVFWCIIVPFVPNSHLGLNSLMGCMHTVNIAFLLLDASINRLSFPWFRLTYFVLWSSAYVIFQWLIHLCGFTWWPYPFLKLSTPMAPLWYLVLAAFHVACYGMYALIVKAKDLLFSKFFPHSYLRPR